MLYCITLYCSEQFTRTRLQSQKKTEYMINPIILLFYGRGQHKTGSFGDDTLRPSPNHGTQRLPNDDDDYFKMALFCYSILHTI